MRSSRAAHASTFGSVVTGAAVLPKTGTAGSQTISLSFGLRSRVPSKPLVAEPVTCHPGRPSSPLRSSLSFRYTLRSLWLNEGFERAYGLNARDFIGRDARELERLGYIKPLITWKVMTTKQRQSAVQRTKAGKSVLATGIPLFDERGNVRKVIINSRDLTELVALQQRLSDAEADLARTRSELAQLRLERGASIASLGRAPPCRQ
jgi:PAS domain